MLRNQKEWGVQKALIPASPGQQSSALLQVPNLFLNAQLPTLNRSSANLAGLDALRSTMNQSQDALKSPPFLSPSADLVDLRLAAPHHRKGLLSSLNILSGKSGRGLVAPTLETRPSQSKTKLSQNMFTPKSDVHVSNAQPPSNIFSNQSTEHSRHQLKTSFTTKADARGVRDALSALSLPNKEALLNDLKRNN